MSIRLGPFELVAPLGQGGMGVVWQGVHRTQDVQVAVKVITEKIARDEGYLKAFRNEVASVARLDHPGIVWLFDYGQVSRRAARDSYGQLVEGSPYLAMELADGGTLSGYDVDGWPELHDIVVQLLDALAHAHARGVIHRDLKPANVLRCSPAKPGGRARIILTDFGIAHALDATETATQDGVMGTLQYMSPEQIRAEWREYGPWTDLYALGNLIWKLATGAVPFAGLTHADLLAAQLHREPPPFAPRFDAPRDLEGWLLTLLAKHPRQRFQCAADAAAALRSLAAPSEDLRSRARSTTTIVPAADSDDWLDEPTETHVVDEAGPPGPPRPARPPSDWRGFPNPSSLAATGPVVRGHALLGVGRGLFGVRTIPLVGRIAERDRLWRELWAVHDTGESRVAVLRGDAGVGKTRLAGWLAERAHEVGAASVIRGRCSPTQAPELALRQGLLRWLHAARLDPQSRRTRVEAVLASHGVRSPTLADRVSELCEPVEPIDGESRHEEIVGLLTALGAWRPVLLVVDDAQWGMDAIRLALRILEAQGCRALVVLAVSDELLADRTVEVGLLEEVVLDPRAAEIRVGPLEDEQRTALVEGVLGLNPELARRVAGRSRGNPLFAVQLIATLVVHDLLLPGAAGFDIRKPPATAPLEIRRAADFPANLGQLWRERLERLFEDLPDGAQPALERAAALGLEVDRELWQQVCDDPDGAYAGDRVLFVPGNAKLRHQIVLRLVAERLAEETATGWNFAHAPVRELLERISRDAGRYAEHHLACATGIRRTWDPSTSEAVGLHLLAGGAVDEGIGLLLAATRHRALSVGFRAALGLLETVETALIDAGIPKSDPRWAAVWLARSALYTRLADPDEALRWARRAEASARAFEWPDQAGNAAIHAGIALCAADRSEEAVGELARGLAEAGEADPRVAALGRAWLANAYARAGRLGPAAAALAEAEQRIAGEAETGLALAWDEYARASRAAGNIVAAREGWTRAAGHWRALGNRIALRVSDAAARIAGA